MPYLCLCVLGTRPEAIKMVSVIAQLRTAPELTVKICVTGQHREMLDQMLAQFGIVPDIDLNLMKDEQSLAELSASILQALDPVLARDMPDLVLVQGDTTTAFASSLAAFYRQIPVAHVEAGLRTGNPGHPFPEELNRVMISRLARWHFAPTALARQQLLEEGVDDADIVVTGNTVIDTLMATVADLPNQSGVVKSFLNATPKLDNDHPLVLVTGHRRENFGRGLAAICDALQQLAERYPQYLWVYPVHLNPSVQKAVRERLVRQGNVLLVPPLDYLSFVYLMQRCRFILTDSGGIQEEAPVLGKPVLVMRESTERQEAIDAGTVKLVGTQASVIVSEASRLIDDAEAYQRMAKSHSPYGDGRAGERIRQAILQWLSGD